MKTAPPEKNISTAELYRMPWTMSDNAFTWLEPTRKCNMACEYCYQRNDTKSQKSLVQIEKELRALFRLRKCDTLIIAGGEPLTHPQIIEITEMVKDMRWLSK
jgi:MoaA/NifB/PqqE/SkfB family radical SAM enzyme